MRSSKSSASTQSQLTSVATYTTGLAAWLGSTLMAGVVAMQATRTSSVVLGLAALGLVALAAFCARTASSARTHACERCERRFLLAESLERHEDAHAPRVYLPAAGASRRTAIN